MKALAGKRILVVEDEALVSLMVVDMLAELGATVVGPATTVAKALALAAAEDIDAALLDVNVRNERVDPVAEALRARFIPVVLATGYGDGAGQIAREAPILDKPYTQEKLAAALSGVMQLTKTPSG
jgi:CheY-like chemotaxis protein